MSDLKVIEIEPDGKEYSCINLTREEFRRIYSGTKVLAYEALFFSKPSSEEILLKEYLPSKLWRLNNCYTIVDKHGTKVRFRMNKAQHRVYAQSLRHPRLIILKSRQQGISTLWLVSFFDDAITRRDFSIGLMAQGSDEAETLLERTKLLWDELSPDVKDHLNLRLTKDNTKEFGLNNGSKIFVRTSFRSTTLQRLHISEMGKIANKSPEKAKETKTGTLQALAQGNIGVVESTAEGDNLFKSMWDNAVTYSHDLSLKDFFPVFLSWLDDPDCSVEKDQTINSKHQKYFDELEKELGTKLTRGQKNFWIVQHRELGDKIYQEYPSTPTEAFMATKEGAYWAKLYFEWVIGHKREKPNLYDKNLNVQLSVDLGMNDTNVLLPFQYYTDGFRCIDEYADSGQDIKFYCDWIKSRPWFENLTKIILPHDAEVKELTSGKTRAEVFHLELNCDANGDYSRDDYETVRNIHIEVLPRTEDINEDIEQVRQALKNLYIDPICEYIKYCLLNFKKEWDDKRERWRNKPEHDEASNGAAAVRYMVIGADRGHQIKARDGVHEHVRQMRERRERNVGHDV